MLNKELCKVLNYNHMRICIKLRATCTSVPVANFSAFPLLPSDISVTSWLLFVLKNGGPVVLIIGVVAVPPPGEMLGAYTTKLRWYPFISVYCTPPSFSFLTVFRKSKKTNPIVPCPFALAISTLVNNALNYHAVAT